MEEQGGFGKGRSCMDHIFTVQQVCEKVIEEKSMVMVCVDLEKAYNKVDREKLASTGGVWCQRITTKGREVFVPGKLG